MTVIEAITRAGGLFTSRFSGTTEELADLHHSFIVRQGQYLPVNFNQLIREGDTSQNIYLEPDDFLYLPSSLSSEVFVIGAVGQPRAVGFKDQVTLISAIANARGTTRDAYLTQVAIIRGSMSTPSIALVNYRDIVQGRAPDVRLQPRDIVFVPISPTAPWRNTSAGRKYVCPDRRRQRGRTRVDLNYSTGTSIPIGN